MALCIVGLGNPGEEYVATRHNIGFIIAEAIAEELGIGLKLESRFNARVGKSGTAHIVLPMTYMNLSGRAAAKYMNYYKLSVSDLLVITDDADIPFGQLRLKPTGSSGGHNGLKNIEEMVGTRDYARLKVGIGRNKGGLKNYVLGRFSAEENKELPFVVQEAKEAVLALRDNSLEMVMNEVNRRKTV